MSELLVERFFVNKIWFAQPLLCGETSGASGAKPDTPVGAVQRGRQGGEAQNCYSQTAQGGISVSTSVSELSTTYLLQQVW